MLSCKYKCSVALLLIPKQCEIEDDVFVLTLKLILHIHLVWYRAVTTILDKI